MEESSFDSDHWLRLHCRDIVDFLQRRTVALLVFHGEPGPENLESRASGVLVRLGEHHFVLTAGHCVKGCVAQDRTIIIPISDAGRGSPHERFSPVVSKSNYVAKDEGVVDYGYLELAAESASMMTARVLIFTGERRVAVRRPFATGPDEWLLVAGYPRDEAKSTERTYLARFMFAFTLVVEKEAVPTDPPKPPNGFEVIDSWLPQDGVASPSAGQFQSAKPSAFQGVSGGGCWIINTSIAPSDWTEITKPSLCGIHASTLTTEGKGDDILREVPVANHLRMIADDYPELSTYIYERWPEVANVPPADSYEG